MKLSKIIDQTRICKKSYDDPLGYFFMGFFFTCPDGQVTNKFHLSNGRFHLSRTNVTVEAWIYGSLYLHSQSGGYTGIPLFVRPFVRP
jgi:hypothetical protein